MTGLRQLRPWILPIAWAILIWIFSTESFSAASTTRFIVPILRWVFPQASLRTLLYWHSLIRKAAHFVEYFIFSLLLLRGTRGERQGWQLTWALLALGIAAGYAALDELHQAFVPVRTASARDVLLDAAGAATAQLSAWLRAQRRPRPA